MKTLRVVALAAALFVATAAIATPSNAASYKYTFSPVTYPDGTTGTMTAGVKPSRTNTFTYCYYDTLNQATVLGEYDSYANTATDLAAVENFCLSHYYDKLSS